MSLRRRLLLFVILIAAVAMMPAVLLIRALRAADESPTGRSVLIVASPAILPVGSQCTVELRPKRSGQSESHMTYEETIAGVSDDGITLTVSTERVEEISSTVGARIPYLGAVFRNCGIGKRTPGRAKTVWISASTIRSVKLAGS
jgi:hypothetical protein